MKIATLVFVVSIFLFSCNTQHTDDKTVAIVNDSLKVEQVPYELAKNYFVKNTFTGELTTPKITTKAEFDAVFGMATTMGEEGKPTAIDFSKQYAIAVIPPKSDTATELKVHELSKKGSEIDLKYSVSKGSKQSFVSQPALLLIVDKTYDGNVNVIEEGRR